MSTSSSPSLEVVVQSPADAVAAIGQGADRLELCVALASTGGLTPSAGLVRAVAQRVRDTPGRSDEPVELTVLVRSAPGGFVLDDDLREVMEADIAEIGAVPGVTGLALGALTEKATVDVDSMLRLVDAVRAVDARDRLREEPLDVVFHRAVDANAHPEELIEDLVDVGCTRVLTSGGAGTAADGADTLRAMVAAANGRLEVVAGGGVLPDDIPTLLGTGVDGVHLSAKKQAHTAASGPGGGTSFRWETEPAVVAEAAALLAPGTPN